MPPGGLGLAHNGLRVPEPGLVMWGAGVVRVRGAGGGRLKGGPRHLGVDRVLALHRGGGELRGGVQGGGVLKN